MSKYLLTFQMVVSPPLLRPKYSKLFRITMRLLIFEFTEIYTGTTIRQLNARNYPMIGWYGLNFQCHAYRIFPSDFLNNGN